LLSLDAQHLWADFTFFAAAPAASAPTLTPFILGRYEEDGCWPSFE
jgi:hypothetical protein